MRSAQHRYGAIVGTFCIILLLLVYPNSPAEADTAHPQDMSYHMFVPLASQALAPPMIYWGASCTEQSTAGSASYGANTTSSRATSNIGPLELCLLQGSPYTPQPIGTTFAGNRGTWSADGQYVWFDPMPLTGTMWSDTVIVLQVATKKTYEYDTGGAAVIWSHVGHKMMYIRHKGTENELYMADPESGMLSKLASYNDDTLASDEIISPDDTRIAFHSTMYKKTYVFDIVKNELLAFDGTDHSSIYWSPDGRYIIHRLSDDGSHVHLLNVETKEDKALGGESGNSVSYDAYRWSSDGKYVSIFLADGVYKYSMSDGTYTHKDAQESIHGGCFFSSYSPDGDHAYCTHQNDSHYDDGIVIIDLRTFELRLVPFDGGKFFSIQWSADSSCAIIVTDNLRCASITGDTILDSNGANYRFIPSARLTPADAQRMTVLKRFGEPNQQGLMSISEDGKTMQWFAPLLPIS